MSCVTCHRGQSKPRTLEQVLSATIAFLKLNTEFYPQDMMSYFFLGELHARPSVLPKPYGSTASAPHWPNSAAIGQKTKRRPLAWPRIAERFYRGSRAERDQADGAVEDGLGFRAVPVVQLLEARGTVGMERL